MTTLLTLAAMFGAVRQNTPRVGGGPVVVVVLVKKYETKCASGNSWDGTGNIGDVDNRELTVQPIATCSCQWQKWLDVDVDGGCGGGGKVHAKQTLHTHKWHQWI